MPGRTSFAPLIDRPDVSLVPASLVKGLEYDHVIVVEPADIVAAEPRGYSRLYVVLTRAVDTPGRAPPRAAARGRARALSEVSTLPS